MQSATLSVIGFSPPCSFPACPLPSHQPEQAACWSAEAYAPLGLGLRCPRAETCSHSHHFPSRPQVQCVVLSLTSLGPLSECRPVITLSEDRDQTLVSPSPSHPQGLPTALNRSAIDRMESKDKDSNVTCLGISCSNRKITMFSKGLRYIVSLGNTVLTEKLHKT